MTGQCTALTSPQSCQFSSTCDYFCAVSFNICSPNANRSPVSYCATSRTWRKHFQPAGPRSSRHVTCSSWHFPCIWLLLCVTGIKDVRGVALAWPLITSISASETCCKSLWALAVSKKKRGLGRDLHSWFYFYWSKVPRWLPAAGAARVAFTYTAFHGDQSVVLQHKIVMSQMLFIAGCTGCAAAEGLRQRLRAAEGSSGSSSAGPSRAPSARPRSARPLRWALPLAAQAGSPSPAQDTGPAHTPELCWQPAPSWDPLPVPPASAGVIEP